MGHLLSGKNFTNALKLSLSAILFLTLLLVLTRCTSSPKLSSQPVSVDLSQEERICLQEFFRDLLFDESGAYTLFGTKPVSTSLIYHFTEEDRKAMKEYYATFSEEERSRIRKVRYDYTANYEKWLEIKARLPIRQYLFGIFPSSCDNKLDFLLFVNIEETLRTLLDYYDDIRRVLGYEFDPFTVVFEVEDKNSTFWQGVLNSQVLKGILFGFGRDNSWFFRWSLQYENQQGLMANFLTSLPQKFDEDRDVEDYSPQDFRLPMFRNYGLHPNLELVKKYQQERKYIQSLYKGRDEVDVALEWLTR